MKTTMMLKRLALAGLVLAAFGGFVLCGCYQERQGPVAQPPPPPQGGPAVAVQTEPPPPPEEGAPVTAQTAPPPPQAESVYVSPGPAYVWVGGSWEWRGQWVWVPGRWLVPPRPGVVWVRGHWHRRYGGWVWVPGHWRD
ncbi:MAG: YXWGXW repeat-containing protein [Verrucomicrobiia bacterium]|jgi:hypothetical protein